MKIYLASSWRNAYQASVLADLRSAGHEVYDFKNPGPGNTGFGFEQANLYGDLTVHKLRAALSHPVAEHGFSFDFNAMKWADACVLLLPSGMSSHLEAGWMAGAGKVVAVLAPEIREPELMYKCFDRSPGITPIYVTVEEVLAYLGSVFMGR